MTLSRPTIVTLIARWCPPNWIIHGEFEMVCQGMRGSIRPRQNERHRRLPARPGPPPGPPGPPGPRPGPPPAATAATPVLQHFITVHDLGDLAVAIAAQRGRHDLERGLALGRGQVAEPQSGPFEDSGWQVGPPHFCAASSKRNRTFARSGSVSVARNALADAATAAVTPVVATACGGAPARTGTMVRPRSRGRARDRKQV